ncbi:hypothetical protein NIT60_05670 [Mammaliicoccus sciuri]|nr:hypothetical protein NIT60_05670 [Mammaliicoccus sciuri]
MSKMYFYVKVKRLDGRVLNYQLPNDLQEAMRIYRQENPKTWTKMFKHALINIPLEPYSAKNRYRPLIGVGLIKNVFYLNKPKALRTRGQFLTFDNWSKKGWKHFWRSLCFFKTRS